MPLDPVHNADARKGGLAAFPDRRRISSFIIQFIVLFAVIWLARWVVNNTIANLEAAKIVSGFGFLDQRSGFPLSVQFIPYSEDSTFRYALLAGFVNTIVMSVLCIIAASVLGLLIGLGRLSKNWLLRNACLTYVEIFRNIPPLLVILFWYFGIFQQLLPSVQNSITLPFDIFINQRGFYFPAIQIEQGKTAPLIAFAFGVLFSLITARLITAKQNKTGLRSKGWPFYMGFLIGLPIAAIFLFTNFSGFDLPQKGRFNIAGGMVVQPEFVALFLSLSLYAAALISETIRAGIRGIDHGLHEAGSALGLRPNLITRLITLPLALRIIIPPLSSQYMNIVKNTSLAGAIAYPDILSIGNSVIEKTNHSLEVVAIWLLVYLGLSLLVSVLMNWFNHKMALKER